MIINMVMAVMVSFVLESPAFKNDQEIPREYTCKGGNRAPKLSWKGIPTGTKSLALTVVDPDAPGGDFIHWIVTDIPVSEWGLDSGIAHEPILKNGATQGVNSFGHIGFDGPCPPTGKKHRYVFTLYALDAKLDLKPGASHEEFLSQIKGHVLSQTKLTGLFG